MVTKASKLKNDLGFATGQEMIREKIPKNLHVYNSDNWHL